MPCRLRLLDALRVLIAVAMLASLVATASAAPTAPHEVEIFARAGCPHCEAARRFVHELARERPSLRIVETDIERDPAALARLQSLSSNAGIRQPGVPTIRIGERLIVGFDGDGTTGLQIRQALDDPAAAGPSDAAARCAVTETSCRAAADDSIELPFGAGVVTVNDLGLPLFTVAIGLLDGFNPCSMWVLVLMLSMLAALRDRRRMLLIAGTFVAIQGAAYFAFMAAWLNLFLLIGLSRASEIAIGTLALVAGVINLKDYFAFGRGVSLSIPAAAKPGIYQRLRAVLHAERLAPALAGIAVLAVMVQLVELLCTSGFPALYTRILTLRGLDDASYYGYLLLYDLMYMLDDVVVLGVGVVTLSQQRLQEKEGRVLKLLAGLAMVGLAAYLLIPD